MTTNVIISKELATLATDIFNKGKTPWVLVVEGLVTDVCMGRAQARKVKQMMDDDAEARNEKIGHAVIVKAADVKFDVDSVDIDSGGPDYDTRYRDGAVGEVPTTTVDDLTVEEYANAFDAELAKVRAQGDAAADALVEAGAHEGVPTSADKSLRSDYKEILARGVGCPYCGDEDNGVTYDDKPGKETAFRFCHICATSFHGVTGALRRKGGKMVITRHSTIERPCKRVWHIADEMRAKANGDLKGMKRKDVLARCVAEGIAFYTARTQYQLWLTIQNGGTI